MGEINVFSAEDMGDKNVLLAENMGDKNVLLTEDMEGSGFKNPETITLNEISVIAIAPRI